MNFFELSTPRHMLDKAHREYQRLRQCFDIDNVFNFLVTANHIRDYVQRLGTVPQSTLDAFLQDQDIKDCRDLCDKGKHVILTKRTDPTARVINSHVGVGKVGEMMVGAGDTWLLESGGRKVDVGRLAERVIKKWESFFSTHAM
jgi:phosphoglycolate phosphatase-like HAD superfamily hydrolase